MASIGPQIPDHLRQPPPVDSHDDDDGEDSEDDYVPSLPPDLLASRSALASEPKPIAGPSFPPPRPSYPDSDSDDSEVGPQPLPPGSSTSSDYDPIAEFIAKEEKRKQLLEEASKPQKLKREEWMLVPPKSSDLLGNLDPTKLSKPRQFRASAAPAPSSSSTAPNLWTETPLERAQRLKDEVLGTSKRKLPSTPANLLTEEEEAERARKRRRDDEIRREVEEHTRKVRGGALLDLHAASTSKSNPTSKTKDDGDGDGGIWDHTRDMSLGGRLMDDKKREGLVRDAKNLGDRFGVGKSGAFMSGRS